MSNGRRDLKIERLHKQFKRALNACYNATPDTQSARVEDLSILCKKLVELGFVCVTAKTKRGTIAEFRLETMQFE